MFVKNSMKVLAKIEINVKPKSPWTIMIKSSRKPEFMEACNMWQAEVCCSPGFPFRKFDYVTPKCNKYHYFETDQNIKNSMADLQQSTLSFFKAIQFKERCNRILCLPFKTFELCAG